MSRSKVHTGVLYIKQGHTLLYANVTRGYNSHSFNATFNIKYDRDDEFVPWEEAHGNYVKFKLDDEMKATLFLNNKKKKR
jgi:hypothetical protein